MRNSPQNGILYHRIRIGHRKEMAQRRNIASYDPDTFWRADTDSDSTPIRSISQRGQTYRILASVHFKYRKLSVPIYLVPRRMFNRTFQLPSTRSSKQMYIRDVSNRPIHPSYISDRTRKSPAHSVASILQDTGLHNGFSRDNFRN